MSKIIPWNLPEVTGGSVGGYTPEPTPTPVPTPEPTPNYPYDLDDIVLTTAFDKHSTPTYVEGGYYKSTQYVNGKFSISGVKIVDAVNVASVTATVEISAGTLNVTIGGNPNTFTIAENTVTLDITNLMTSSGGDAVIFTDTATVQGHTFDYIKNAKTDQGAINLVSSTSTLTVTKITVYNANGVAIQEWEPGE